MEMRCEHLESREEGDVVVARIKPESSATTTFEDIAAEILSLIKTTQCQKILINLQHVEYLQSTGLGSLVLLEKTMAATQGQLRLCGLSSAVEELFQLTGLDNVFTIRKDEEDGLSDF